MMSIRPACQWPALKNPGFVEHVFAQQKSRMACSCNHRHRAGQDEDRHGQSCLQRYALRLARGGQLFPHEGGGKRRRHPKSAVPNQPEQPDTKDIAAHQAVPNLPPTLLGNASSSRCPVVKGGGRWSSATAC